MRGRNTLPLLSRASQPPSRSNSPGPSSSFEVYTATRLPTNPRIPTIRLVEATPSPDTSANQYNTLSQSPAPLAPKEFPSPRKKLVPKKSKLALLTSRASSSKARERDLSDIVRRVGEAWSMDEEGACNVTVNGGNACGKGKPKGRSSRSTIDIYVDPSDDPDIGEIVVVKKKKSRAALDGIRWAFGEVTNNNPAEDNPAPVKPKEETEKIKLKIEEKEKWWSIGRSRRDTKEKEKEKENAAAKIQLRRKAPSASAVPTVPVEPTQPATRLRNRSLDSKPLLCVPSPNNISPGAAHLSPQGSPTLPSLTISGAPEEDYFSAQPNTQSYYATQSRLRTGSTPGLLQPPDSGYSSGGFYIENEHEEKSGSLAVRAMRSVRSLARIGSWAQLKNTPALGSEFTLEKPKKKKDKAGKADSQRIKTSSSSWEVGALSSVGCDDTTRSRYGTMAALGIGTPSSRVPESGVRRDSAGTLLSVKTAASGANSHRTSSSSGLSAPGAAANRFSVSSADSGKAGSTYSASGEDTGGFGVPQKKKQGSVKWGDVVVGGDAEKREKIIDRNIRRSPKDFKQEKKEKKAEKKEKETKAKEQKNSSRNLDGRRRTPVTSVFPDLVAQAASSENAVAARREKSDETGASVQVAVRVPIPQFRPVFPSRGPERQQPPQEPLEEIPVPPARPRVRPMSEQLLGTSRPRPKGIIGGVEHEDNKDAAVISVLEAANSDLASLINRLDLEATPDTKNSRPVSFAPTDPTTSSRFTLGEPESPSARRGRCDDSPLKKSAETRASITSLRSYSQSYTKSDKGTLRAGNVVTVGRVSVPDIPPLSTLIGQPIALRSSLVKQEGDRELEAPKERPLVSTLRVRPKNFTVFAPTVEEESLSIVQPLQPRKGKPLSTGEPAIRTSSAVLRARAAPFIRPTSVSSTFGAPIATPTQADPLIPSSNTFGTTRTMRYTLPTVQSGSSSPRSVFTNGTPTPSPGGPVRKGSTIVPFVKRAVETIEENQRRQGVQETPTGRRNVGGRSQKMDADVRRDLGFKGTLGVTDPEEPVANQEDEDSDIPDELQIILSGQSDDTSKMGKVPVDAVDDTLSFVPPQIATTTSLSSSVSSKLPPSPGLPPVSPLPMPSSTPSVVVMPSMEPSPPAPTMMMFLEPSPSPPIVTPTLALQTASEDGENEADVDEPNTGSSGSDDDTKESFDFTGELQRLNESGAAHRRSFVEQLEHAFKTPAKLGADQFGFEINGFLTATTGQLHHISEQGVTVGDLPGSQSTDAMGNTSMINDSAEEPSDLVPPSISVTSRPSYGRLDTAFKFGGKLPIPTDSKNLDDSVARELPGVAALSTSPSPERTLPDLPCPRARASSTSMVEEDSSVLRSIFAKAAPNMDLKGHRVQLSIESDNSSKRRARQSQVPAHARSSSDVSFSGMSSFGAVRTKFEFGPGRPAFFPASCRPSISHVRQESIFSIASISSYGEVINHGTNDPFNYGTLEEEEPASKDGLPCIDETMSAFESKRSRKRFSADSDVSSFYYRAPSQPHKTQQLPRNHDRNQSVISTTSMNGPPISLYNRSLGHKRNDSAGSASSIANAYGAHGASGGRVAWVRHQHERSIDSVLSDFSASRLGRPGVGDKMFDSVADHAPLTSISASPPESVAGDLAQKSSFDSILDDDQRSTVDSIFDNTGQRSSMSSDSVFGFDTNDPARGNLFPPAHFRPLSIISMGNPGTPGEDDTMISMLGGGHVRRRSIGSSFDASPCVRVEKREKRKQSEFACKPGPFDFENDPDQARLVRRASMTSLTSSESSKFGEDRMMLAQRGLLQRNSLEDSALSAEGEEDFTMNSIRSPVFTRPTQSTRPRAGPLVTISQPPDTTPPLSSSEGSQSASSQSSIDIERLKVLLQTASAGTRSSSARARARGQGHRRRVSQVSRSSAIGTIHEENPGLSNSPSPNRRPNRDSFDSVSSDPPSPREPPPTAEPSVEVVEWDDEQMVIGLRKYYALRSEADETITHSKMLWLDTPFSLHALQTFTPPSDPAGMQALLEHSQKTYIPLPSELCSRRVRSRTSSINRPSPYPRNNVNPSRSPSSTQSRRSSLDPSISSSFDRSRALQSVSIISQNLNSPPPALAALAPFSPLALDLNYSDDKVIPVSVLIPPQSAIKPIVRPRVGSAARRNALGWSKRKTPKGEGKSLNANKENEAQGLLTSPTESLRIVRPRPRGRIPPTPRITSMVV